MRSIAIILSIVIFGQSLSVCGPEIAHNNNHSLLSQAGCSDSHEPYNDHCRISAGIEQADDQHGCCADKTSNNHQTSDSSGDEKDCCGDACHCFCCTKVMLNNAPLGTAATEIQVSFSAEPCTLVVVHSFDFHQSISNPPQYAHLS
jgi:hypothetical protein